MNYSFYSSASSQNTSHSNNQTDTITFEHLTFDDYKIASAWQQATDDDGFWRLHKGKGINDSVAITPNNTNANHIALIRHGHFAKGTLYFSIRGNNLSYEDFININNTQTNQSQNYQASQNWQEFQYLITEGQANLQLSWQKDTNSIVYNQQIWLDEILFLADVSDHDNDGILDQYEYEHQLDFYDSLDALNDNDNDGLTNLEEFQNNTNPNLADSDGDGLTDESEVNQYNTNPNNTDSDGDKLNDNCEVIYGFDPLIFDEQQDSDGDYFADFQECDNNTNPLDANSTPDGITIYTQSFEQNELPENFSNGKWASNGWTSGDNQEASDQNRSISSYSYFVDDAQLQWNGYFVEGGFSFDYKFTDETGKFTITTPGFNKSITTSSYQWRTLIVPMKAGQNQVSFYYFDRDYDYETHKIYIDNIKFFPKLYDSDGDSMPDIWELEQGLNRSNPNDATTDLDQDGLRNIQEYQLGTSAKLADTDGDSIPDKYEVDNQLNPTSSSDAYDDADSDGINNITEYQLGLNPQDPTDALGDLDNDGINNVTEITYGLNPQDASDAQGDLDNDGINNVTEILYGLDPTDSSDAQGDIDNDGMSNISEISYGLDPLDASDAHEDKDNDGFSNLEEIRQGSDPTNASSIPSTIASWIYILLNDDAQKTTHGAKQ